MGRKYFHCGDVEETQSSLGGGVENWLSTCLFCGYHNNLHLLLCVWKFPLRPDAIEKTIDPKCGL